MVTTINGKDILATWGARLVGNSIEQLLTPPPMKDYIVSNSRLYDGRTYTIPAGGARTDERPVTLSVVIRGSDPQQYLERYRSFLSELSAAPFTLTVSDIPGITFTLVYRSASKYGSYGSCRGLVTLRLTEPEPALLKNSALS